jgi:hypothetical protein
MSRNDDEGVTLYYHRLGTELGVVELVVPSPEDSTDQRMICRSEAGIDFGVIYSVDLDTEEYESMCEDNDVATMLGVLLESTEEEIQILETPEEEPLEPPEEIGRGAVRSMRTPGMWKHPWGRCCCVKHGGEIAPVTTEAIRAGDVPWWGSPFTPYQLDMIQAAADPDSCAMHVLASADRRCGVCGHFVWCVVDEDVPEELPVPPEDPEIDEPLVPERNALTGLPWKNKKEAWQLFWDDPANDHIMKASGLCIHKVSAKRRYSTEEAFDKVNSLESRRGQPNIYTIKAAFYAALGNGRSGSWADLDLDLLRMVKGLENVDLPAVVLEEAGLEGVQDRIDEREARADDEADADVLNGMLDDDDFIEPGTQDEPPRARPQSVGDPKAKLVMRAQALQRALGDFIEALGEFDMVPKKRAQGG